MNRIRITVFLLLLVSTLSAQKKKHADEFADIDSKAMQIPDSMTRSTSAFAGYLANNFTTNKEKVRAAYIWVVTHIDYDIGNMFAINFYESREEKISRALRNRKGICEEYAALFTDICNKAGIKSYVVEGYTKQHGFTDYIPHAWSAALVDSAWCLFEPTWGSGYIDDGKFYKKINPACFNVSPSVLIKSHMPFDFMWQFLYFPVTNQEFYEGKTLPDPSKPFYNYTDSIAAYEKLDSTQQLMASASRVEKSGVKNAMVFDRLQHLKMKIENDRQQIMINQFNVATANYNDAVNYYNDFVNYRNKQFTPSKPDTAIKNMIDPAAVKLQAARDKLHEIKDPSANINTAMAQLFRGMDDLAEHVKEQQDWLATYLSKGKIGRKSMFYSKITWMGIPLKK